MYAMSAEEYAEKKEIDARKKQSREELKFQINEIKSQITDKKKELESAKQDESNAEADEERYELENWGNKTFPNSKYTTRELVSGCLTQSMFRSGKIESELAELESRRDELESKYKICAP